MAPAVLVVVDSLAARGSGEERQSVHLELPVSGLKVPGWQASHRRPLIISLPSSHSHLAEPSARKVWMKPSWQVQSLMEVDAMGDEENSGQGRQAVPMSEPSSGLYVPSVQSTIKPAVHHLPLRQTERTQVSRLQSSYSCSKRRGMESRAALTWGR